MKKTLTASACVLSFGFLLGACTEITTADCDPSVERNILYKMRAGNCYDERTEIKQATLNELKASNEQIKLALAAAEQEKGEVRSELASAKQDYAALNAAMEPLLDDLRKKSADDEALRNQVAELEAKLAAVNETNTQSTLEKRAQIDSLTSDLLSLQEQLSQ